LYPLAALRSLCAVIPDPLEGTPRRLDGTADRCGRSRTDPGVKEEIDEKPYLHRVEELHTPVLPLGGRARGVENRDFILRGQRLGKVLGDDRDLQFALPGDR